MTNFNMIPDMFADQVYEEDFAEAKDGCDCQGCKGCRGCDGLF